jgi:hypothetical protein
MIRLIFEDNGTCHDDLVLRFPGGEHRCDSYYYAIHSEDESTGAIGRVIHALLSQWLSVVEQAEGTDTVYLPFDFSDQCTGWIRCELDGDSVQLDVGWSLIEGWSFLPSDIVAMVRKVTDFHHIENAAPIAMDRGSLVAAIKDNMREFES